MEYWTNDDPATVRCADTAWSGPPAAPGLADHALEYVDVWRDRLVDAEQSFADRRPAFFRRRYRLFDNTVSLLFRLLWARTHRGVLARLVLVVIAMFLVALATGILSFDAADLWGAIRSCLHPLNR